MMFLNSFLATLPKVLLSKSRDQIRSELVTEPLKIFISYDSADAERVRDLHDWLISEPGLDPWLDKVSIKPGQTWERVLQRALKNAQVAIVCLSNRALKNRGNFYGESEFIRKRALSKPEDAVYVIPVKLEECGPSKRFARWQMVDLYASDGR